MSQVFNTDRIRKMLIGYARVSTEDQNLNLQRDALTAAGCERIFEDKASGARDDRPGLTEALSHLRQGDCLVIWRLDRLGRRMIALLGFVDELRERGCDFRILNGSFPIDTTTAQGRLLFHISAALAENERDVIRERTIAGLASARARGRKGGRPVKLTAKQVCTARKMLTDPEMTIKEVAEAFGVNRATIYRSLGLGSYAKGATGDAAS
jgi:Enterobacteriaceae phage serine recombinase